MLKTLGNILILTGIAAILTGLILRLMGRLKWVGRLPGDIVIQKGNFTFYFPLMTGLLASLFLSLLLYLVFKFFLKR
jgi:predicted phosphohydrolase